MALIETSDPLSPASILALLQAVDAGTEPIQAEVNVFSVFGDDVRLSLVGNDFEYDGPTSAPSQGTVTDFIGTSIKFDGEVFFNATALDVDVERINDSLPGADPVAALRYILRDDDTIITNQIDPLNDDVYGFRGDDTIMTGGGADNLHGGWGDDILKGQAGSDHLWGGRGDDLLDGGVGVNDKDILEGGRGADTFVFYHNYGQDTITDFGKHDTIRLSLRDFATLAEVQANWAEVGDDVVITAPPDTFQPGQVVPPAQTLTIENTTFADLSHHILLV